MSDKLVKCSINVYDKSVLKPPYTQFQIGELEVIRPDRKTDEYGSKFATNLFNACKNQGFEFQFYTMGNDRYDYRITVRHSEKTDKLVKLALKPKNHAK